MEQDKPKYLEAEEEYLRKINPNRPPSVVTIDHKVIEEPKESKENEGIKLASAELASYAGEPIRGDPIPSFARYGVRTGEMKNDIHSGRYTYYLFYDDRSKNYYALVLMTNMTSELWDQEKNFFSIYLPPKCSC